MLGQGFGHPSHGTQQSSDRERSLALPLRETAVEGGLIEEVEGYDRLTGLI